MERQTHLQNSVRARRVHVGASCRRRAGLVPGVERVHQVARVRDLGLLQPHNVDNLLGIGARHKLAAVVEQIVELAAVNLEETHPHRHIVVPIYIYMYIYIHTCNRKNR